MILESEVKYEIEFFESLKEKLLREMEELNEEVEEAQEGEIFFKMQHGKKRPYVRRNGEEVYLKQGQQQEIERLLRRRTLWNVLEMTERNLNALRWLSGSYTDTDRIMECLDDEETTDGARRAVLVDLRQTAPYDENEKRHVTPNGVRVRSKSELILACYFESQGIEYVYEYPLELNGTFVYVDFRIKVGEDRYILWEHFGMMNDSGYREKAIHRIGQMIEEGYRPGQNLILTFDDMDGSLDMRDVTRMVGVIVDMRGE